MKKVYMGQPNYFYGNEAVFPYSIGSLAAYAWDDYDSVCAAYYMGLYYFEEAGGWET